MKVEMTAPMVCVQACVRCRKCSKPDTVVDTSVTLRCFSPLRKMLYMSQNHPVMFCLLQIDADRAVFVAVTSRSVFELDDGDEACRLGLAHPLLQVLLFY